jgi:hypothetical protein
MGHTSGTAAATTAVLANVWNHICFTYDSTNTKARIYLNGVIDTDPSGITLAAISGNAADAQIGASQGQYGLNGYLYKPAVWNQRLTDTEVADLYISELTVPTTILLWQLGAGASNTLTATGAVPVTPTIVTSGATAITTVADPGSSGKGLVFFRDTSVANSGTYISIAGQGVPAFAGSYSKCIWLYLTTLDGFNNVMPSVDVSGNGHTNLWTSTGGSGIFTMTHGSGGNLVAGSAVSINTWNQVCTTFDSGTSTGKIYLNGALSATGTLTPLTANIVAPIHVGSAASGFGCTGYIYKPAVWSGVLTQGEITALYAAN